MRCSSVGGIRQISSESSSAEMRGLATSAETSVLPADVHASVRTATGSAMARLSMRAVYSGTGPAGSGNGPTLAAEARGLRGCDFRAKMIPGFPVERGGPEPRPAGILFGLAEYVRRANLHRQVLPRGVLFEIDGEGEALDEIGAD